MGSSSIGARLRGARGRLRGDGPAPRITVADDPADPRPVADFRFFAIVKTWMDEDIIEATVRNAFAQGVEAVYLVDNASTDATVERAVAAGASLAESYRTDVFEGRITQVLMNAVVARVSLASEAAHVWWLFLDSDEFPEGPGGISIREHLAGLDRRFRLVGATYYNHAPAAKPEYLPGFHPIDFQPLCQRFEPLQHPPCGQGHWKHPLQRFDRDGLFVTCDDGYHSARVRTHVPLEEPSVGIVTHHFQYRDEAVTRDKLELTCGPTSTRTALHESIGNVGFVKRRRSIDAVYEQRWADVASLPNRCAEHGFDPTPWPDLARVRRWYDPAAVDEAKRRWAEGERSAPVTG